MKVEILNHTEKPLTTIGKNSATCYDTKLKDEGHPRRIAEHCLRSGHMRNIEFARVTVKITASARMIREWYTAIAGMPTRLQASTRYITYNEFEYFTPEEMTDEQLEVYEGIMAYTQKGYAKLKELGCTNDVTGYVLPLAMESVMICEINARTLMTMFEQRLCHRALKEYKKLMHILKGELMLLDDEWFFIAKNYFKVKCDKLGYCPEDYGCTKVKKGAVLNKEEFEASIREGQSIKRINNWNRIEKGD